MASGSGHLARARWRQGGGPARGLAALGLGLPPLDWYYGPTAADPDPGKMWCRPCGGEVWVIEDAYMCSGCHRTAGPDLSPHHQAQ